MKHSAERTTLYWLIFKGRALGGPEKAYVDTMDVQTLWKYMQWFTGKAAGAAGGGRTTGYPPAAEVPTIGKESSK